ncbi:unnamed protein product, partial [marine sediment metagenome]
SVAMNESAGWQDIEVPAYDVSPGSYWVAIQFSAQKGVYYNAATRRYYTKSYGAFDAIWPSGDSGDSAAQFNMRVTYTTIKTGSATLSGTGTLTAAGTVISGAIYGSATLSGTGTLAAKGAALRPGAATLAGTGTLAAVASCIRLAAATLQGTGSLTAAGTLTGLTATLLAAQKKAHRLPYVEAKAYDYEQGIKRLSWTRLYTGSEPDNHHGLAFDGQGSVHRVRAAASNTLYRQKITNPGPSSDYSQWTQ